MTFSTRGFGVSGAWCRRIEWHCGTERSLRFEDEEHGSEEAAAGPEIVPRERGVHVEESEGDEDAEGDDFLQDFELRQGKGGVADAIGGDLKHILEEGDAPTGEDGDKEGFGFHVLEVGVPSEGHEEVGDEEESDGFGDDHGKRCLQAGAGATGFGKTGVRAHSRG